MRCEFIYRVESSELRVQMWWRAACGRRKNRALLSSGCRPIGPLVKGGEREIGGLPKKQQPFLKVAFQNRTIPPSRPAAVPPPFDKGGKEVAASHRPPCERGRKRRSGDCLKSSSRSWKWHFKIEKFLRHAASLKRHLAARQSLRHGLRPCHLPLTREAKRLRPPIGPLVKGGWLRRKPQTGGLRRRSSRSPFRSDI